MTVLTPKTQRPDFYTATEGEFAGWHTWKRDTFESTNGPFWHRFDAEGRGHCAFRVEKRHLNAMHGVHGGCLMTFADYSLFAFARPHLDGPSATVSFACDFLDAPREGELVEANGEVIRAGGSLIVVRGLLTCSGRAVFSYSGTIKRLKRKIAAGEVSESH